MNARKLSFIFCGIIPTLLAACTQAIMPNTPENYQLNKSLEGKIVLGEKLANPYSVDNMRNAAASLGTKGAGNDIEPNWLYVRFQPKDSTDLRIIEDMDLYCYPLDYEIIQDGSTYHDPDIPEDELTWMYTRVRPDYDFPSGIRYEILEECYIPEYGEYTKSAADEYARALEREALRLSGYETCDTKGSSSGMRPSGCIKVYYDDPTNAYVPLRGVKVKCHHIVKFASAFTDDCGNYSMNTAFQTDPKYSVEFENRAGFTIWNGILVAAPASANFGKGRASGMSILIDTPDQAWKWACINNIAYKYIDECDMTGMAKPPRNLKMMVFAGSGDGYASAPMLRRLSHVKIDTNSKFVDTISDIAVIPASAALLFIAKLACPDITCYCGFMSNAHCSLLQGMIWHELAHATHFTMSGKTLWTDYASLIMTNGFSYGKKSHEHSDLIDLGESWALAYQNYMMGTIHPGMFESGEDFNWRVLTMLLILTLTPREMSSCMTEEIRSVSDLKQKLIKMYAAKSADIESIFKMYAI